jgi:hypothetical protein
MGMYAISRKQCGKPFMWFSGSLDQRCYECKGGDAIRQIATDNTKSTPVSDGTEQ